jgi:hypothetical protein
MYLAPLNVDWFFKKVFSDKRIARSFLQDLLKVKITEITLLATDYKISNDAVLIRFDFRCKIKGQYVIIEMQQRYKPDVNKRFYLYHCVSTAVQLETLEPVIVTKQNGETYTEKNYSGIEPVTTVIWMADDTLGFKEDTVTFTTLPEAAKAFITDKELWQQPWDTILKTREKTLKIINNKTKNIDFLAENKMIYVFQANIFKNKTDTALSKWIELAEKSRNPNNTKEDFLKFKNNKIMAQVIKRLEKMTLVTEDQKVADYLEQYEGSWLVEIELKNREVAKITKRAEKAEAKVEQAEKEKAEQLSKAVAAFLGLGKDIPYISDILGVSEDAVEAIIKKNNGVRK